jgi:hypothetical protein
MKPFLIFVLILCVSTIAFIVLLAPDSFPPETFIHCQKTTKTADEFRACMQVLK